MRKMIAALLALSMVMSASALPASAVSDAAAESSSTVGVGLIKKNTKFVYSIRPDGSLTILDIKDKAISSSGKLTLPSKIDGRTVVSVSDSAARFLRVNCKKIKVVDIPDSIRDLPENSIGFTDEKINELSPKGDDIYGYKRYTGVKIICSHNSFAELYAVYNGVKYDFRNNEDSIKGAFWKDKYSISLTAIRFRWNEVEGADGYEIHRYEEGGNSILLKTVKGNKNTEFKDSKLKRGKYYEYKILPYRIKNGKKEYGMDSALLKYMTRPAAPSVSKATPTRDHSVAVKVEDLNSYSDHYRAEIMDPETKEWKEATYESSNMDGNDCLLEFSGYLTRNPFTGRAFNEPLVSGKKYKFRFCRKGKVQFYSHYKYLVGDRCKTLTLKAK